MVVELTAIYEPIANGVRAYVAEIAAISVLAATEEEARAFLMARIRLFLEYERAKAFAGALSGTRVESIRVEMPTIEGTGAEAAAALPLETLRPNHEAALFQTLLEQGRIDAIPPPYPPGVTREEHEPIPIEGRPISEEIIEERR